MEKFMKLFPIGSELLEFLDANQSHRPVTIRANPLKVRRGELAKSLISRGMNVPVGATPEYLAGHYIIQGMCSFLPVMALQPKPVRRCWTCAPPWRKDFAYRCPHEEHWIAVLRTTLMQLFEMRCRAVIGNLHRMGVNNATVSSVDGVLYAKMQPQSFDRVLLDAPCSGTGVIWKDESVKTSKDHVDIKRRFTMQRRLLLSAIDAVDAKSKSGGVVVYSTCSVLVEEMRLSFNLQIGLEGFVKFREYRFHPSMVNTRQNVNDGVGKKNSRKRKKSLSSSSVEEEKRRRKDYVEEE
uniref:SAM-dependent MTase RsmB/NOP-type domain-containing protein n=1 Tax=Ditylenchus dipsaci TaxID=166011 RepID=A0A915E9T3_9BILA